MTLGKVKVSSIVSKRQTTIVGSVEVITTICYQIPPLSSEFTHPQSKAEDQAPPDFLLPDIVESLTLLTISSPPAPVSKTIEIKVKGYIVVHCEEYDVNKVSSIDMHYFPDNQLVG